MAERKPIIMLSRVDRERLERGDISSPEEALTQYDYRPPSSEELAAQRARNVERGKSRTEKQGFSQFALTPRDKEIIANIPPHFGKI